ncbi:hypothetical protein A1Q5_15740 [Aliivibrio logei 5S-186]|uniref:Lipid/polyisoprenoid-binding YceI-like domain-containing protein n=2 Tax=Aliivibrio logei TaxID=688 RepID=A0ABX3B3N7_ALILO|nr:hypothetical protein A1Q5_15740 [Aliivibrio logei 5S-186]
MKYILSLLMFFTANSHADTSALDLSTNIDINNLYSDSITKVEFIPSTITLDVSSDKRKFEEAESTLRITTDIPKNISGISYLTTLIKNDSFCTDYSGITNQQVDFVEVALDGQVMNIDDVINFSDFNFDDGVNKIGEHSLTLNFKPFDEIILPGTTDVCNGEIEFNIEVEI